MSGARGAIVLAAVAAVVVLLLAAVVPKALREIALRDLCREPSTVLATRDGDIVTLNYQVRPRSGNAVLDLGGSRLVFLDWDMSGRSSGALMTAPGWKTSGSTGTGTRTFRDEIDGQVLRFWFAEREFTVRDGILELEGRRLDLVAGGDVALLPRQGPARFQRLPRPEAPPAP